MTQQCRPRFRAKACLNLIVPIGVYLCTVCGGGLSALSQETQRVPLNSRITEVQPMTGIVLWSDNDWAEKHSDSIALEYRYCGYDEVVDESGGYDWSKIESVLDDIASRNHQAILRFYFVYVGQQTTVPDFIKTQSDYNETIGKSESKRTSFCDWTNPALQEFTLDFYSKFAERYDRDPRIAYLQTGFGLWAEYHIYSGPKDLGKTFPSKEYQIRFLRHLHREFSSLPWSISIDAADYDYTPLEGSDSLLQLGFGLFDDSFLCKSHPKENAVNWRILDPNRWKRQPGGGELSYYNKKDQKQALAKTGPNGIPFETAAKQFHISYMIGNDQPRFQESDRIKSAGMATGYRFRITSASVRDGDLTIQVTNEGIAPIYRDAYFLAGDRRSTTSLKGLLPGESLRCLVKNVNDADLQRVTIQSDAILSTQKIQFAADLH